jgi:copper oxidase (laccase) domain-containing protein
VADASVSTEPFPLQHFPALDATGICLSAFVRRIPGIDVRQDKTEALKRLDATHRQIRNSLGVGDWPLLTAEQVHGNDVVIVEETKTNDEQFPGCDGLITNQRGLLLGIHVADCCAVYMVDPATPVIALVHSGRKGTELNIAGRTLDKMSERFGTKPGNVIVQLSPCIRPPHYEVDFAAEVSAQCRAKGVRSVHDEGENTACDLEQFYSYRMEKGRTGRMLALLGLRPR